MTKGSPRIQHLDGLRSMAVLAVFVHHYVASQRLGVPGSFGAYLGVILGLGFTGVDLFFVLSGYLIGGILIKNRESPKLYTTFYFRRFLRIVPLSLVVIGVQLVINRMHPGTHLPWSLAVYCFFATNLWMAATASWGYGQLSCLWSLAIEEQFYLVAPFLVRRVRPENFIRVFSGMIIAAWLCRLSLLAASFDSMTASFLPFCRMDSLGFGLLCACLIKDPTAKAWISARTSWVYGMLLLGFVGFMLLAKLRAGNASPVMALWGYGIVSIFFAAGLLLLELGRCGWLSKIMCLPFLVWLGQRSFFIYLFEGLAGDFSDTLFASAIPYHGAHLSLLTTLTTSVIILLMAEISWRMFEYPLLNIGHRRSY